MILWEGERFAQMTGIRNQVKNIRGKSMTIEILTFLYESIEHPVAIGTTTSTKHRG